MSEDTKKQPLSTEQRTAIITAMFQSTHRDLGAITKILLGNPLPTGGYLIDTEVAGEAVVRITRAMSALEKLIAINVPPSQVSNATIAKDGALVATFSTAPAPPDDGLPVMTPAALADQAARELLHGKKDELVQQIQTMTVGAIETTNAKLLVPDNGTEAAST